MLARAWKRSQHLNLTHPARACGSYLPSSALRLPAAFVDSALARFVSPDSRKRWISSLVKTSAVEDRPTDANPVLVLPDGKGLTSDGDPISATDISDDCLSEVKLPVAIRAEHGDIEAL